jgi:hypothetical protein
MKQNREKLLREIAGITGQDCFEYISYGVGNWGEHKAGGIRLDFQNASNQEGAHTFFNAIVTYQKKSGLHKKGSRLPAKRFSVRKGYAFYKFWLSTNLSVPKRLGSFYDYMGNLRDLCFVLTLDANERVAHSNIRLLSVSNDQLQQMLMLLDSPIARQTRAKQFPNCSQTVLPNKQSAKRPDFAGLRAISSTGYLKYAISQQGRTCSSINQRDPKDAPIDQPNEDWLKDYCRTGQ